MACDACDETRYLLFSITFRIFMFYKGNAGADKLCDITLIWVMLVKYSLCMWLVVDNDLILSLMIVFCWN